MNSLSSSYLPTWKILDFGRLSAPVSNLDFQFYTPLSSTGPIFVDSESVSNSVGAFAMYKCLSESITAL